MQSRYQRLIRTLLCPTEENRPPPLIKGLSLNSLLALVPGPCEALCSSPAKATTPKIRAHGLKELHNSPPIRQNEQSRIAPHVMDPPPPATPCLHGNSSFYLPVYDSFDLGVFLHLLLP